MLMLIEKSAIHVGDLLRLSWAGYIWLGLVVDDLVTHQNFEKSRTCILVTAPDCVLPSVTEVYHGNMITIHCCYVTEVVHHAQS